ncbi:MAG: GNAT family N-acetyltransferase [Pyrinomonadaceae bacterium]|nr:GNAT family N-acetyltransferase [Pyrinomonadaceae bacterium]MDQ3134179.1 GNAT family N-acetyltransferase [Acidobacteriota bacterium]
MSYGWEGEKVRLVPLEREKHFENALVWLNDTEVTRWTLIGDQPLGRLAEEEYFARVAGVTPHDAAFAVETLEAGEHIGFAGINQIDWRHGVGLTGTIIGRTDCWGQGYGSDAAIARTRYAFEVLGLRMLISRVFAENTASLRMLEKAGYREVGRCPRRYWKRGAYRDVVEMMAERG